MAIKPTIYKTSLEISDIDRNYYGTHQLTVACHPSETVERMMLRILAFAINAGERLEFGADIGDTDEPALWEKDLTGAIKLWIEIGNPDERIILRACGRSDKVIVYSYGRATGPWWNTVKSNLERAKNLSIYEIERKATDEISQFAARSMKLHCVIQDNEISFGNDSHEITATLKNLI